MHTGRGVYGNVSRCFLLFFFFPCKRYILSRLVVDRFLRPISVSLCRRRWPLVSIRIRVQVSRCSLRRDHFESSSENKAGNGSVKRPFLFFFVSPRNAENGNRASFLISGRNANVSQLPVSTRVIRTRPEIKREYGLKIKAKENVIRSMNEMRCFEHHNAAYIKKKKKNNPCCTFLRSISLPNPSPDPSCRPHIADFGVTECHTETDTYSRNITHKKQSASWFTPYAHSMEEDIFI